VRTASSVLLILLATLLVGCGGSDPVTTGTLPVGRTVGADQYLADAAIGAGAVRDFAAVVATLPDPATPVALRAAASDLAGPLKAAEGASQRLSAMRLEDQRLEKQRAQSASAYASVLAAMRRLEAAARAGNPVTARQAAIDLNTAATALREVGTTTTGA